MTLVDFGMPRHVYVHVPFCARRCSYCDFAIAVRRSTPVREYLDALRSEIAPLRSATVDTIYFGGGTPSRLGADGVRELLAIVRGRYEPDAGAEITLEANPDDVTPENARAWFAAGVNRLSLGVQSFDDRVLAWMHRTHDARTARTAVAVARDAGFGNISLDLIFALPEELRRDWSRDLGIAAQLEPEHVSLYGLTVESATPLARWRDRGAISEAPEERYESEYLLAHETLVTAGFEHYEVSNFARNGFRSRHNSAYWISVPYAGHGPAAHGFDGVTRTWNEPVYSRWVERVRSGIGAAVGMETLTTEQRELERAYLGLRTDSGYEIVAGAKAQLSRWQRSGWAEIDGRRLVLTPTGWLRLDALTSVLTGNGSPCNV